MKTKTTTFLAAILLFIGTAEGQIYHPFEFFLEHPDIVSRETYFLLPGRDTFILMNLAEIDRENKIAWEYSYSDYYGTRKQVVIFTDKWKPAKHIFYSRDSYMTLKWLYSYNDKNQIVGYKKYSRDGFDNYQKLHLDSEVTYSYNSKGLKTGFQGTFYIIRDTITHYQNKRKIKYDRKGREKMSKFYTTKDSPNKFKLSAKIRTKYSRQNDLIKQETRTIHTNPYKLRKEESFYNEQNQRVKSVDYRDGKAIRFIEYEYLDNLKIKTTYTDSIPETNGNFVVKYIYHKKKIEYKQ